MTFTKDEEEDDDEADEDNDETAQKYISLYLELADTSSLSLESWLGSYCDF